MKNTLILLQIPVGIRDDEQEELLGGNGSDEMEHSTGISGGSSGNFSSNGGSKKSCVAKIWRGLDSKLMKPLLTSRCEIFFFLLSFCQIETIFLCSVCILFYESVFIFQFLNDKV